MTTKHTPINPIKSVIPHYFSIGEYRKEFYIFKHGKRMRDWRAGGYSTQEIAQSALDQIGNRGQLALLKE